MTKKLEFTQALKDELEVLCHFDGQSTYSGIKVHSSSASQYIVEATKRLYAKGMITQEDGGYLTPRGTDLASIAQECLMMLTSGDDEPLPRIQ